MFDIVQHPTELCTVVLRFPGGGILSMNDDGKCVQIGDEELRAIRFAMPCP